MNLAGYGLPLLDEAGGVHAIEHLRLILGELKIADVRSPANKSHSPKAAFPTTFRHVKASMAAAVLCIF